MEKKAPVIIAVCGKGGVGKTSVSALLTRTLCENSAARVLAIDADPAVGLSIALGLHVSRTVDDIRNDLIGRIEKGDREDRMAILSRLDYELFESIAERGNLAFLAIGRPETDGCYCQINEFLKDVIREIAGGFDYVVIDAEAGIEQINRRVMEMVTHLIIVTDTSAKGRNVAVTIDGVARRAIACSRSGVIFNRLREGDDIALLSGGMPVEVLGTLPEEGLIREFDMSGRSFFELPSCAVLDSMRRMTGRIIQNEKAAARRDTSS